MKRNSQTSETPDFTNSANSILDNNNSPPLVQEQEKAPPYQSPDSNSKILPQSTPLGEAYFKSTDSQHLNAATESHSVVELTREDYYCIRCIKFCFRKPKLKYWHFVTGLCTTNPKTLPIVRMLFAVYILVCYVVYMITGDTKLASKDQSFFFLTVLGFIALWLYFVLAGWYSWTYARDPKGFVMNGGAKSTMFHSLIQILYSLNVPVHLVISVVYWSLLARAHYTEEDFRTVDQWINISAHGLTLIMLIIEIALNQMRFYFCHIIAFMIAGLIYSIWTIIGAFIYQDKDGKLWAVYEILNLSKPQAGYWYLALFGFGIISYLIVILIHHLKYRYIKTRSKSILIDENGDVESQESHDPRHTSNNIQKNETVASAQSIYPSISPIREV